MLAINPNLYVAQDAAVQAMQTRLFERHTTNHLSNSIVTCIDAVDYVINGVVAVVQRVAHWIFSALNWLCPCIGNTLYPINPINGKRHLVLLPRVVERTLGNCLYELITFGMAETPRRYREGESINQKVQEEFLRIKNANAEILGARRDGFSEGYDYRVKVVNSTSVNAFACAGGGMVVFTEIIRIIRDTVENNGDKIVDIHFADGSTAQVDVSNVSVEDVIAALLSHEMTHVASRHTLQQLVLVLFLTIVLNVVRSLVAGAMGEESSIHQFLLTIQDLIMQYLLNYHSRVHEYEADVTGLELMRNAGRNPLGAIYLQEILTRMHRNGCMDWAHHHLEFLFTHPYGEHRKRALFAALSVLAPESLRAANTRLTLEPTGLDTEHASPGVCFARTVKTNLTLPDNPIPA